MATNKNVGLKPEFWSKIKIMVKNRNLRGKNQNFLISEIFLLLVLLSIIGNLNYIRRIACSNGGRRRRRSAANERRKKLSVSIKLAATVENALPEQKTDQSLVSKIWSNIFG